ncbi:MAG: helix-turn-helix transcriptional regulator [Lachnospiraceae bacterium]|nr:helix-turn-helix transcriptional regulator [Lachnospiraceae bacterium]MBD5482325.1 helix-turn-helix transcriptional regulator [Lachnospiraceae bacterium]
MKDHTYRKEFCNRLTRLRMEKDVSARDMSLSLGLSESYINKIENEKTLPSMSTFFDICDYFHITPMEFFNMQEPFPFDIAAAVSEMNRMSKEQISRLIAFMKDINHRG